MGPIYGSDKTEDELLEHVKVHIPLGRLGEPREIADAVAFFLSNFSSFVTGQVLVVGGGM
jgi:3-oxoacyl-[acyl-carrier protein] reductase